MTRKEILETAEKMVNGSRQEDYGSAENNFGTIASFWDVYMAARSATGNFCRLEAKDVAAMLILLKVARIASGHAKSDNWIDAAGYAACGGEIESKWNTGNEPESGFAEQFEFTLTNEEEDALDRFHQMFGDIDVAPTSVIKVKLVTDND